MKPIKMPKLSPTMETGILGKWLVKAGDIVKKRDVIGEIETDKAIMEIESTFDGVVGYLLDIEGKEVKVNEAIGFVLEAGEQAPDSWEQYLSSAFSSAETAKIIEVTANNTNNHNNHNNHAEKLPQTVKQERIFASPLARKIASMNNLSLEDIKGTGPGNRIVKNHIVKNRIVRKDVEAFLNARTNNAKVNNQASNNQASNNQASNNQASNSQDSNSQDSNSQFNNHPNIAQPLKSIPIAGTRKIISDKLAAIWQQAPHIFLQKKLHLDALYTQKIIIEQKFNLKLSITTLLIKLISTVLQKHPKLNATLENHTINYFASSNIGVAVFAQENETNNNNGIAHEGTLIVPVLKNAESKSLSQISNELQGFVEKAKNHQLKKMDTEGQTFTISNLGMYDIDLFTAIINPPAIAILAISGVKIEPIYDGTEFAPAKTMNVVLSADHRAIDGVECAKFLQTLYDYVKNPIAMII